MTFDHHDDDIEAMMRTRALEQGRAFNARTVLGTQARNRLGPVPVAADPIDLAALRAAVQQFMDAMQAAVDRFNEVMREVGDTLSKLLEQFDAPPVRHGHASVCPRHGPTKAGLCTACAVAPPSFQRLPNLPPALPATWKLRGR